MNLFSQGASVKVYNIVQAWELASVLYSVHVPRFCYSRLYLFTYVGGAAQKNNLYLQFLRSLLTF